jgi:hypothetical protein
LGKSPEATENSRKVPINRDPRKVSGDRDTPVFGRLSEEEMNAQTSEKFA